MGSIKTSLQIPVRPEQLNYLAVSTPYSGWTKSSGHFVVQVTIFRGQGFGPRTVPGSMMKTIEASKGVEVRDIAELPRRLGGRTVTFRKLSYPELVRD